MIKVCGPTQCGMLQKGCSAEILGQEVKQLAPFFSKVKFRARTWRETLWASRAAEGHLVAPCTDVSKGYVIRVKDGEVHRLYATTLVYSGFRAPIESPELEATPEPVHKYEPTDFPKCRPPPKRFDEVPVMPEVSDLDAGAVPLRASVSSGAGPARVAVSRPAHECWPRPAQHTDECPVSGHQIIAEARLLSKVEPEGQNSLRRWQFLQSCLQLPADPKSGCPECLDLSAMGEGGQ